MGRKAEDRTLEVKIPPSFRCPISLDVMRSPVSLCTGVTYDRSSIQRWLDSGNATCPATMQSLPSTDLVPNLTLLRLIRLWSSSKGLASSPDDLLSAVRSDPDPVRHLRRLAGFLTDPEVDDFAKNSVVGAGGCAAALASLLSDESAALGTTEAVVGVLALIFTVDRVEEENRRIAADCIASDLERSSSALIDVLRAGSCVGSRIDAARVLEALLSSISDRESKALITEKAVLWGLCHVFRDRRAQEAVAAAAGGVTKILLLMQSDCSPAVRRMGGDLLKMFRVNSKSCLSRYETKTTHIMPF